jgi:hypothetical protein
MALPILLRISIVNPQSLVNAKNIGVLLKIWFRLAR